jgi:hypothetical protein
MFYNFIYFKMWKSFELRGYKKKFGVISKLLKPERLFKFNEVSEFLKFQNYGIFPNPNVQNIVTCWVCHATNNFTWVSDLTNHYWAFTLTHCTIIITCSITITASTISRPILDCFLRRLFHDCLLRRLFPDLYLRPLLRNEPFVVTVETPVITTIPRLLLPSNGLFYHFHGSNPSGFQTRDIRGILLSVLTSHLLQLHPATSCFTLTGYWLITDFLCRAVLL